MKTISVAIIALVGALCSVCIQAENQGDEPISSEIWEKVKKIRAELTKMKADDKVDDQKLIADVQSLVSQVQSDLKSTSASLQSQLSGEVTAITSKVTQMTNAGKFDPTVLQLFKGIAKATAADKNGSKTGSPTNKPSINTS